MLEHFGRLKIHDLIEGAGLLAPNPGERSCVEGAGPSAPAKSGTTERAPPNHTSPMEGAGPSAPNLGERSCMEGASPSAPNIKERARRSVPLHVLNSARPSRRLQATRGPSMPAGTSGLAARPRPETPAGRSSKILRRRWAGGGFSDAAGLIVSLRRGSFASARLPRDDRDPRNRSQKKDRIRGEACDQSGLESRGGSTSAVVIASTGCPAQTGRLH